VRSNHDPRELFEHDHGVHSIDETFSDSRSVEAYSLEDIAEAERDREDDEPETFELDRFTDLTEAFHR
jgi:hypothetical protein